MQNLEVAKKRFDKDRKSSSYRSKTLRPKLQLSMFVLARNPIKNIRILCLWLEMWKGFNAYDSFSEALKYMLRSYFG